MTARQLAREQRLRANVEDLAGGVLVGPGGGKFFPGPMGWVVWFDRRHPRALPTPDAHVFIPWADLPKIAVKSAADPSKVVEAVYFIFTKGGQ